MKVYGGRIEMSIGRIEVDGKIYGPGYLRADAKSIDIRAYDQATREYLEGIGRQMQSHASPRQVTTNSGLEISVQEGNVHIVNKGAITNSEIVIDARSSSRYSYGRRYR